MRRSIIVEVALAVALAVLVTACAGSDDSGGDGDVADVSGREWVLQELDGEPVPDGVTVTLLVDDGQLSGSAGCNRYVGAVDLEEPSLTFDSEIAQTMMACPDDVTAVEDAYLAALATVTDWRATDDTLTLTDADGVDVVVFG